MKKLFLAVVCLLSLTAFADSNCDNEAIEVVSQLTMIAESDLEVIGRFNEDLVFYTFVADTYNESLVYEVKQDGDSQCYTIGFYETSIYANEFGMFDSPKEASVFLNAKY